MSIETDAGTIKRFPFDVTFEFIEDPHFIDAFQKVAQKIPCPTGPSNREKDSEK